MLEILETENPISNKPNALDKNSFDNQLSLENISFKYEEEYVLKNFNLTVPKGHTVALVGQSGSGKSTIANLVTRFYDVNEGSITIDGTDIKDLTKHSLRSLLGLVTQDSILFNDTVANNIGLGKKMPLEKKLRQRPKLPMPTNLLSPSPMVMTRTLATVAIN